MQSSEANKFKVIVNSPEKRNKAEYDLRVAKVLAKILMETLPSQNIEKLIDSYRKNR